MWVFVPRLVVGEASTFKLTLNWFILLRNVFGKLLKKLLLIYKLRNKVSWKSFGLCEKNQTKSYS